MSTALKLFFSFALFFQIAMANSIEDKTNLVAAEKEELAKLANRSDLTVKEWLRFVDDIDAKCSSETVEVKQTAMCSFYYEIYKIGELFAEAQDQKPTWEQCMRAGVTSDSLSVNESTKKLVNRIAVKLCPKR